jgi:hypothetical protein
MAVTNRLAYHGAALIYALKMFYSTRCRGLKHKVVAIL